MLQETSENLQATQHQLIYLSLKHTPYREKLFYYACVLLYKILSKNKNNEMEFFILIQVRPYLYNNGDGKWIHCAHLACLRNRLRQIYCQAPGPGQVQVQVMPWSRSKSTTNSKLKFQRHNLKSKDLERHYNQMSPTHPPTHPPPPLNFSKLKISSFQSYPLGSGQVPT